MIKITQKGHFDKSIKFLHFLYNREFLNNLNNYGEEGVKALEAATPVDTGLTAKSWSYSVNTTPNRIKLEWYNSNMAGSVPVAILLQYGHATKDGYYVQGVDFINPALAPVFDNIAERVWSEVTKA